MKCGAVDFCIIVAIIGCFYYLWNKHSRDYIWAAEYAAGDENVPEMNNVVHSSRNCKASGEKSLVVVLELMYSGLLPLDVDVTGDILMKNLFSQCTCGLSDDYCFQWTLTINQMNYSITDVGRCRPSISLCSLSAAETFPTNRINATLGLIHPIVPPSAMTPRFNLKCLQKTVLCALNAVDPRIVNNTYVQAVLSSAKENTT